MLSGTVTIAAATGHSMPSFPLEERRQSQCPSCQAQRGAPFAVKTGDGNKTITYRCPTCHHEWQVVTPDSKLRPLGR